MLWREEVRWENPNVRFGLSAGESTPVQLDHRDDTLVICERLLCTTGMSKERPRPSMPSLLGLLGGAILLVGWICGGSTLRWANSGGIPSISVFRDVLRDEGFVTVELFWS